MQILIIIVVVVLILLALAGGFLVFMRRRRAGQPKPAKKKSTNNKGVKTKPATVEPKNEPALPSAPPVAKPPVPAPASAVAAAPVVTSVAPAKADETGDKIRILVVDDNPDTRENVSRLLYFEDDMQVIGQAINGRQGIDMAVKHKPHIVLMDINMPDIDGITATREMSVIAPFCQVIIMSVQAEQHYMKQAMAAGARDFQPKPFTADELVNCIRRVYKVGLPMYSQLKAVEQSQAQLATQPVTEKTQMEGSPVIVVYSPKGGIGTSTIAANLAVALQQEHGDIVLMDADLQFGDILVHLNTKATRTMSDLIHDGLLDAELLPEIVLPHNSGLKLLLAPPQPEIADAISAEMISEIIHSLKKHFKAVVIDTSSQLNDKTLVAMENADHILLVTTPELPAIKSAKQFLDLAGQLELSPNQIGVIINRANLPGGVPPEKMEKALKIQQSYRIPYDPKMHLAINKGIAITQQEASAPSAQAITAMAQDLWEKLAQSETTPPLTEAV